MNNIKKNNIVCFYCNDKKNKNNNKNNNKTNILKIKKTQILLVLIVIINFLFAYNFSFFAADYLPAPQLISPMQASVVGNLQTKFIWSRSYTADYYSFQATTDVTFLNFNDVSDIIQNYLTDTVYISQKELLPDTLYFWRVNANTTNKTGEWSNIGYFKTHKNVGIFSDFNNDNKFNFNNKLELKIFPNPTSDILQINFSDNATVDIKKISLYLFNMHKQCVKKVNNIKNLQDNFLLDCDYLPSGTYTIFLFSEENEILAIKNFSVVH